MPSRQLYRDGKTRTREIAALGLYGDGMAVSVEGTKERIHYYMDWIRLLWAAILLNGSGIVGLASTLDSRAKIIAFIAGVVFEGAFVILLFLAHRRADALITKLEEAQ